MKRSSVTWLLSFWLSVSFFVFVSASVEVNESKCPAQVVETSPSLNALTSIDPDLLQKLDFLGTFLFNRFRNLGVIPRLSLRLLRDHPINLANHSIDTIYICMKYLESPASNPEAKKKFLKDAFNGSSLNSNNFRLIANSFQHPICHDAMKFVGDSISLVDINWLYIHAPAALFDNFELITSLNDYSFFDTMTLKTTSLFKVCSVIDFLSIPNFVKTAPIFTLCLIGNNSYVHHKHYNILIENRPTIFQEIANYKDKILFYPFLSNFIDIPTLPTGYAFNSTLITNLIRKFGFNMDNLLPLLVSIQESNDFIMGAMFEISKHWAELHKNSQLSVTDIEYSERINKEFNEKIKTPLNNLTYVRERREEINKLIEDLEANNIVVSPTISEKDSEWLKHLKLLAQVPFNAFLRKAFNSRCSSRYFSQIYPDDVQNTIPLPRLVSMEPAGFLMEADPNYIYSPFMWSSLWRNVFYVDGENWRQDPEAIEMFKNNSPDFESYLKPRYEVIYRDSVSSNAKSWQLLDALQKLTRALDDEFETSPRYFRFIASFSSPAPPSGLVLSFDDKIERQILTKKVILALEKVKFANPASLNLIKTNFSDSETIQNIVDDILLRQESIMNYPISGISSMNQLESLCIDWVENRKYRSNEESISGVKFMEAKFAALGKNLTDAQINFMSSSNAINQFLKLHGRALSFSQVSGLLKCESGRKFLKNNSALIHNLLDYSEFTWKDFNEFEIDIELIRLGTSSIDQENKLLLLSQKGFSSVNDPMILTSIIGTRFWKQADLLDNLSAWEILNPLIISYDIEFFNQCGFINHMFQLQHKLSPKVMLNEATKFLIKWLIAQDWYAFQFHVTRAKYSDKLHPRYIDNLNLIYRKLIEEGEIPARAFISQYMQSIQLLRGSESLYVMAQLNNFVDCSPLTSFRKAIISSGSELSILLGAPFIKDSQSPPSEFLNQYIQSNFTDTEKNIWLSRLEILNQFSCQDANGRVHYANESRALTRQRLHNLSNFDAIIYKWALELEGVNLSSIFRDPSNTDGLLEINLDSRTSVIPPLLLEALLIEPASPAILEEKKTEKSKKNKKKNGKK